MLRLIPLIAILVAFAAAVSAAGESSSCPFTETGREASQRRLDQLLAQIALDQNQNANQQSSGPFASSSTASNSTVAKKPNILFLIVDDLDKQMETLKHCPKIQKLLADQGTTWENQFVSMALCCPIRASIMTGRFPRGYS